VTDTIAPLAAICCDKTLPISSKIKRLQGLKGPDRRRSCRLHVLKSPRWRCVTWGTEAERLRCDNVLIW